MILKWQPIFEWESMTLLEFKNNNIGLESLDPETHSHSFLQGACSSPSRSFVSNYWINTSAAVCVVSQDEMYNWVLSAYWDDLS